MLDFVTPAISGGVSWNPIPDNSLHPHAHFASPTRLGVKTVNPTGIQSAISTGRKSARANSSLRDCANATLDLEIDEDRTWVWETRNLVVLKVGGRDESKEGEKLVLATDSKSPDAFKTLGR